MCTRVCVCVRENRGSVLLHKLPIQLAVGVRTHEGGGEGGDGGETGERGGDGGEQPFWQHVRVNLSGPNKGLEGWRERREEGGGRREEKE